MLAWYWILFIVLACLAVIGVGIYFGFFYGSDDNDTFLPVEIPPEFLPELYVEQPKPTDPTKPVPSLSQTSSQAVTPLTSGTYIRINDEFVLYAQETKFQCFRVGNPAVFQEGTWDKPGAIGQYTVFQEFTSNFYYVVIQVGNNLYSMMFTGFEWVPFQTVLVYNPIFMTSTTQAGRSILYLTIPPPNGGSERQIKQFILASDEWTELDNVRPFRSVQPNYGQTLSGYREYLFVPDGQDLLIFIRGVFSQRLNLPTTVLASVYGQSLGTLFVANGQLITVFCLEGSKFKECFTANVTSTVKRLRWLDVGILFVGGQVETALYPVRISGGTVSFSTPVATSKIVEPYFPTRDGSTISLDTGTWQVLFNMVLVNPQTAT